MAYYILSGLEARVFCLITSYTLIQASVKGVCLTQALFVLFLFHA